MYLFASLFENPGQDLIILSTNEPATVGFTYSCFLQVCLSETAQCTPSYSLSGSRTWIFFVISCTAALWSDSLWAPAEDT